MIYELSGKRVYVAGDRGMVGSALVRRLASEGCTILTAGREEFDLRCQAEVEAFFREERPEAILLAAATVGGIVANDQRPAEFLYDNLMIEANVIEAARRFGAEKLLLLGSSCIYPKFAPQPIPEHALLTGELEPTNQWYAVAKIAGIKLCQAYRRQHNCDFISVMPSNLYGPNDFFDPANSHVIPALLAKAHAAKETGAETMLVWGTGTVRREFLHVDDLADACVFLMKRHSGEDFINIGTGTDVTVRELATLICKTVGFRGGLVFDTLKPDGTPRKLLDTSRLTALGWRASTTLPEGLQRLYSWFIENQRTVRGAA